MAKKWKSGKRKRKSRGNRGSKVSPNIILQDRDHVSDLKTLAKAVYQIGKVNLNPEGNCASPQRIKRFIDLVHEWDIEKLVEYFTQYGIVPELSRPNLRMLIEEEIDDIVPGVYVDRDVLRITPEIRRAAETCLETYQKGIVLVYLGRVDILPRPTGIEVIDTALSEWIVTDRVAVVKVVNNEINVFPWNPSYIVDDYYQADDIDPPSIVINRASDGQEPPRNLAG